MRILKITLTISLILLFTAAASAKIVFTAYKDGSTNIYVMDDDGSNIRQITNTPARQPRWSPDGTQIAFLRDTDPSARSVRNTFIMNADGTNIRQLTTHRLDDKGFAFSPDGKKLVVSSHPTIGSEGWGLYVIDIESGDIQKISNLEAFGVDWSPDGKTIVFCNDDFVDENIWIMNTDGTNAGPLIPPVFPNYTLNRNRPRWSPDGQNVLYTETDRKREIIEKPDGSEGLRITWAGTFRYQIRNLNGNETQTLKIPSGWYPNSVAWMDGQKSVLFGAFVDYEHILDRDRWTQIYKYDIASGIITQLTFDHHNQMEADWVSNDGASVTSVSPAGKQSVRWGQLKKAYSD